MSNFLTHNLSETNRYSRKIMMDWIVQCNCTHAITLVFNKYTPLEKAVKDLGSLFFRFDKHILGRKAHKMPSSERSLFFAFPEHISSNLHFHIALRLPNITSVPDVCMKYTGVSLLEKEWGKITYHHGNVLCRKIETDGWAQYITKEMKLNSQLRHDVDFYLSNDFHNDETL